MNSVGDRFWSKVDKRGPDECWLWMGAVDRSGYGRFFFDGKNRHAHQVALLLDGRPAGGRVYGCHHCDVKLCVNPRHLYVGDASTNRTDAIARGLMRFNPRRGEASHKARLTAQAVLEIRDRYVTGEVSQHALAREYGVTQPTIGRVVRRDSWTHV